MGVYIVGVVCAVLGTYVVLRGMAFLFGFPLALGALLFAVLTAGFIGWLTGTREIKEDTAIGVVFAGLFALGVAMLSAAGNFAVDLSHVLFGDLLGVSNQDLIWLGVLGVLVLICVAAGVTITASINAMSTTCRAVTTVTATSTKSV